MGARIVRIHNTFNSSTGLDLSYYLNEVSSNQVCFTAELTCKYNGHYYCPV